MARGTSGLHIRSSATPCIILGKLLYFSISDLLSDCCREGKKTFSVPQRAAGTHRESLPNMFEKWKYFK